MNLIFRVTFRLLWWAVQTRSRSATRWSRPDSIPGEQCKVRWHTFKDISLLYCITKTLKGPILISSLIFRWLIEWVKVRVLARILKTGCPKLAIVKFGGVLLSGETTMYSDYSHKCIYLMQWSIVLIYNAIGVILRWKKNQSYAWNWHLKKFLTNNFWCVWGWFLRVWVSKWRPAD